ncbi:MAG TPA: HD domain-containing protein [Planctomycetaceae bacterium]|nr:HD domain-containing protein [Planctomycetaceae bacterium]
MPGVLEQTIVHIRQRMAQDSSGHDWFHVQRVWQTALALGKAEGADLYIVQLAALLHDIADWKFHEGDELAGPRAAEAWLTGLQVAPEIIAEVCDIVAKLSFKGAGVAADAMSLEGQVVQDADRLDAIGAIGIARAFAYGGHAGRLLYDPAVPPETHATFAAYKRNSGPTINHFYEKLLLLADRMNTASGRKIARDRHRFLEEFLNHFYGEWNGDDVARLLAPPVG